MHPYPHLYTVQASAQPEGDAPVTSSGLPTLTTAPPAEFGGPGDRWSPETLFCAAVASCFLLSFRAVARASKFDWLELECRVDGTLQRVEKTTRFTEVLTVATLRVPAGGNRDKAIKLMEKAENVCLISNSLVCERRLEITVVEA
jgi:organic hydroperoxide reductase OsmC/OhrA